MKNLLVLFALVLGTVCFTSCEKDEETVDPIVGTWENASEVTVTISGATFSGSGLAQWVVKADKTGQFTLTVNGITAEEDAFTWSKKDEVYTFVNKTDPTQTEEVVIGTFMGETTIETPEGLVLATKVK